MRSPSVPLRAEPRFARGLRACDGRATAAADVLHRRVDATIDGVEVGDLALDLVADLDLVGFVLDHVGRRDERLDALADPHEHAVVDHARRPCASTTRARAGTR